MDRTDSREAKPKVTVVTACLNQGRFIGQTLESVMEQTYSPIEHVVIDGGSTDGTLDVLGSYEARYDLRWISERDRGLSHAFNKGIAASSGQWLYFLNGDDYLVDEDAVARVMGWIATHPGYAIYMGGIESVDEERARIAVSLPSPDCPIYTQRILLESRPTVMHQGTFYRRHVFDVAGPYSEDYRTHMDYEFHLRATKYFQIAAMSIAVGCLRNHPLALSQRREWRRYIELARARRAHGGSLVHRHNLYFLKGVLATSPLTRRLYERLAGTRLGKAAARASGWHDAAGLH